MAGTCNMVHMQQNICDLSVCFPSRRQSNTYGSSCTFQTLWRLVYGTWSQNDVVLRGESIPLSAELGNTIVGLQNGGPTRWMRVLNKRHDVRVELGLILTVLCSGKPPYI